VFYLYLWFIISSTGSDSLFPIVLTFHAAIFSVSCIPKNMRHCQKTFKENPYRHPN